MNVVLQNVGECLYRAEDTGIYYAVMKNKGRQIRKSLRTTSRPMAERERDRLRAGVRRLRVVGGSFEEVARLAIANKMSGKKPRSLKRRVDSLKAMAPWFANKKIAAVSDADVNRFITERGPTISSRTFNIELETLNMVFESAINQGMLLENPARNIARRKSQHRQPEIPTKDQFATLITTIRAMHHRARYAADLLELLAYSGMRLSEATAVKWRDVDFERHTLRVTGGDAGTKNWEHRTIPLFPPLEAFLLRVRDEQMKQLKLRRLDDFEVVPILNAKTALTAACKIANLPHITHHHCRHFFASNAIEAGIDFKAIAGWLGHKDGGVLVAKVYGHLRDEHSRLMADKMTFSVVA